MSVRPRVTCHEVRCARSVRSVTQPMGSIDLLTAQAPPVMLAERYGRRGSQVTWSLALPLPAAVPAGYGPCAEAGF
jgi:hypothetical protein